MHVPSSQHYIIDLLKTLAKKTKCKKKRLLQENLTTKAYRHLPTGVLVVRSSSDKECKINIELTHAQLI